MAVNPKVTRILARAYDIAEEDVPAVIAVNAEVARQSIEDGLAAMDTTVTAPPSRVSVAAQERARHILHQRRPPAVPLPKNKDD